MKIILTESQFKRIIIKEETTSNYPEPDCYRIGKRKNNPIPVTANAYDLQRFLKEMGHDIGTTGENGDGVDGDFSNKSAKAFADFFYHNNSHHIKTLDDLYEALKKWKYDVGDRPGFGIKMAKVLSKIASDYIKNLFDEDDCYDSEIYREKLEREKKSKEYCIKNKSRILNELKQLWYDWAKSPVTKKKLMDSLKTNINYGNYDTDSFLELFDTEDLDYRFYGHNPTTYAKRITEKVTNVVKNYSANNIKCYLESEDDYLTKNKPIAYQSGNKIVMNCSTTDIQNPAGLKTTMLHEFTHYIDDKMDYINLKRSWRKALPLVMQGHGTNIKREDSATILKLKKVKEKGNIYKLKADEILKQNLIKDFEGYGITEEDLVKWLRIVGNDDDDYDCRQTEKEANLKSLKLYFCNNLTCDLTMDHIKKIIKEEVSYDVAGDDAYFLMKCWASNGYQPSFKDFLNGLNALALTDDEKNNIDTDNFA